MGKRVAVTGVGMTRQRSARPDVTGQELINEAVRMALADAGMTRKDIDAVVIGNMDHFEGVNYVDTWSVDGSGALMKPIMKLTTGGTTGSTIAMAAYYHVASGLFDRVLAIGWEKNSESDTTGAIITAFDPFWDRPIFAGAVAGLALEATAYMHATGATEEDAAYVAVRERKHALNNPYAHLHLNMTIEDVMNSPYLSWPVKMGDMCPRTDGACALVFASEDVADDFPIKPAWVLGVADRHLWAYTSDPYLDFKTGEAWFPAMQKSARDVYDRVGITDPLEQFDVAELYLPYSFAGLRYMESLGFCGKGEAPALTRAGTFDMGGKCPVNPSGGVMSSNAIGATAIIRVAEAAWQIQGRAEDRQVPDVKLALATGFGGCFWSDILVLGKEKPEKARG
ncbi:MAG: thiolase family protein [Actinomycetota bacterium]|nr:thiolase family protein [Actinomycetota bacterium]MDD5667091.1 thiolase family protein [Actinomycetota bacterium]